VTATPPRARLLSWRLAGTIAIAGVALIYRATALLLDERRGTRARLDGDRRR
jgi:hypothetical protein